MKQMTERMLSYATLPEWQCEIMMFVEKVNAYFFDKIYVHLSPKWRKRR